jgi:hypothetical protein
MNSKIHAAIEIGLLLQSFLIPSALPSLRPSKRGDSTILAEKHKRKAITW